MAETPTATIAVVPRETLSQVRACLEALVANTIPPYRLVVVDGSYGKSTRRWIDGFVREHDASLIRSDCVLTPNEARNVAFEVVDTEYVVFLDDNCFVRPGWLAALVRCAEETGAAIVGPLYGWRTGRDSKETVHVFGAEAHIAIDGDRRELVDRHFHSRMPLADVTATLSRTASEAAEFHCMLVRASLFDELGPLDEGLLSMHEHLDLCMLARDAGHAVWVEPASVVVIERTVPLARTDRAFYILRWSDRWNRASIARFAEKWQLSDGDTIAAMRRTGGDYRSVAYRLNPRFLDRVSHKLGGRPGGAIDMLAQAFVVPHKTRRRATGRGPRLVHTASWHRPWIPVTRTNGGGGDGV
jgi:GT2 family glycosyltransferase